MSKIYKHRIWKTSKYCELCGIRLNYSNRTVDHIIPKIAGGTNSRFNLIASCKKCNYKKGSMDIRKFRKFHNIPAKSWNMIVMTVCQYIIKSRVWLNPDYIKGWLAKPACLKPDEFK